MKKKCRSLSGNTTRTPLLRKTGSRCRCGRSRRSFRQAPAAVTVGDEKISVAQIRRITTVDSDPFVKLFVAELDRFFDLSPTALRIVTVLIKSIGKIRVGDGDQVYITENDQRHAERERSYSAFERDLLPRYRRADREGLHRAEHEHTSFSSTPRSSSTATGCGSSLRSGGKSGRRPKSVLRRRARRPSP